MTYANQNINLEQYYNALPASSSPKAELLRAIAKRCGVSLNTARNWVTGSCKPSSQEHLAVLAELTGINPDKLF